MKPLRLSKGGQRSPNNYYNNDGTKSSLLVVHLTPITLELGGKCPAVVDSLSSSWDLEAAVKRIIVGKYGTCAGQAYIAIDYVLVEKSYCSKLVELMKVWTKKMFGDNPEHSKTIARIVNKHHFYRLKNLVTDQKVKEFIVYGGSMDEENLFIEPTILVDPPVDALIMSDEIFGPLLPIITLDKIENSIEFISSRPKPLALYVFTKNKTLQSRMISKTSSGNVTFNDAILQYAADSLPFGGVCESGFGMYHGKFSFDTFSHQKAIVRRSFITDFCGDTERVRMRPKRELGLRQSKIGGDYCSGKWYLQGHSDAQVSINSRNVGGFSSKRVECTSYPSPYLIYIVRLLTRKGTSAIITCNT